MLAGSPIIRKFFRVWNLDHAERKLRKQPPAPGLVGVSLKDLWKSSNINGLQAASKAFIKREKNKKGYRPKHDMLPIE